MRKMALFLSVLICFSIFSSTVFAFELSPYSIGAWLRNYIFNQPLCAIGVCGTCSNVGATKCQFDSDSGAYLFLKCSDKNIWNYPLDPPQWVPISSHGQDSTCGSGGTTTTTTTPSVGDGAGTSCSDPTAIKCNPSNNNQLLSCDNGIWTPYTCPSGGTCQLDAWGNAQCSGPTCNGCYNWDSPNPTSICYAVGSKIGCAECSGVTKIFMSKDSNCPSGQVCSNRQCVSSGGGTNGGGTTPPCTYGQMKCEGTIGYICTGTWEVWKDCASEGKTCKQLSNTGLQCEGATCAQYTNRQSCNADSSSPCYWIPSQYKQISNLWEITKEATEGSDTLGKCYGIDECIPDETRVPESYGKNSPIIPFSTDYSNYPRNRLSCCSLSLKTVDYIGPTGIHLMSKYVCGVPLPSDKACTDIENENECNSHVDSSGSPDCEWVIKEQLCQKKGTPGVDCDALLKKCGNSATCYLNYLNCLTGGAKFFGIPVTWLIILFIIFIFLSMFKSLWS